jgi:hypothetical protein
MSSSKGYIAKQEIQGILKYRIVYSPIHFLSSVKDRTTLNHANLQ